MQRWQADDDPDRPWVRRRYRDDRKEKKKAARDRVIDLTDGAEDAPPHEPEIDGRDFAILSRFRARR